MPSADNTVLVAFEGSARTQGLWVHTAPGVREPWLIPADTLADYTRVRSRYNRLLAKTRGLGQLGGSGDTAKVADLAACELWLRAWSWTWVLRPLVESVPAPARMLLDTSSPTLDRVMARETLWSRFVVGELDEATLYDWQPYQLYGAAEAEHVLATLAGGERGYARVRIVVQLPQALTLVRRPTRLDAAQLSELAIVAQLSDQLGRAAHARGVQLSLECDGRRLRGLLLDDTPGMLTILVCHQNCDNPRDPWLELGDGPVRIHDLVDGLAARPRGHWVLFVCHAEQRDNLAQALQDHGAPLVFAGGKYSYLRESLALLLVWLNECEDVHGRWFCSTLTRARVQLHKRTRQEPCT